MAESKMGLKSLLVRMNSESERASLKPEKKSGGAKTQQLRSWHWPHYFMTNRRGKMEVVSDFLFLGPKIIVDGDCSHEIRR